MCGVAGFVFPNNNFSKKYMESLSVSMGNAIAHRGPDGSGVWLDVERGVGLVHRRLSIIDLSPAGSQPMLSDNGRFVIVYNGEVYNCEEIREALRACGVNSYRGHSDTEVILEAISQWGIEETFRKMNGMFACAVWDRREAKLSLVRDRLGIKPLYWAVQHGKVFFASELKALYQNTEWAGCIDRGALASYLRHGYVQGPWTIHQGVEKLKPGCVVTIEPSTGKIERQSFWDMKDVVKYGCENQFQGSARDAVDSLEDLLSDAIQRQMVSDVPLGAFLSGGIDSSVVTALMQRSSSRPVKTFSIGFEEAGYNEAQHAAEIAKHLGSDHTELYVSAQDALDVIPKLADIYDEPFADSSQIPTYLVSEMTQKHVTVALSGDGGDELFAGYSRYFQTLKRREVLRRIPEGVRSVVASVLRSLPGKALNKIQRRLSVFPDRPNIGGKLNLLGEFLSDEGLAMYRQALCHWHDPEQVILQSHETKGILWSDDLFDIAPSLLKLMRYLDTCSYLPDDILTKVDRASMAVSLEARVPLLDHRVVEFAWALPDEILLKDGEGKWPLRQVLDRYVPRELSDRPKMGFGVPLDKWLRGPLREWAEELLSQHSLSEYGLVNPRPVLQMWKDHVSGKGNYQYQLWDIIMLQSWSRRYL
ncbi:MULTISPECIES: asparagine synthase (glutamine-hydrolyzing) [unclassified Thalassospira]|uniref:asparagine synthase (glutamine-hydrolyzing) n=1 Tax=unclassified Thalassospira TaxID=2648997 RepID=UPI001B0E14F3|nr:asparagine synthase (glutamine-hydrolyzing) [Thalassospira sp.]MBO6769737.1 asparagine synthase (glutamine-hydrolyzing) [Thalassospira sp.]